MTLTDPFRFRAKLERVEISGGQVRITFSTPLSGDVPALVMAGSYDLPLVTEFSVMVLPDGHPAQV